MEAHEGHWEFQVSLGALAGNANTKKGEAREAEGRGNTNKKEGEGRGNAMGCEGPYGSCMGF